MKRKKGKYRIGLQRDWAKLQEDSIHSKLRRLHTHRRTQQDWDDWTSKTLGIDGPPPWWAVPCDIVDIMSDERMVRGMPLKERSI